MDARAQHKSGASSINACISNPSGANTDAYITDKGDGTYRVEYTPYEDGETFCYANCTTLTDAASEKHQLICVCKDGGFSHIRMGAPRCPHVVL